MSFEDGDFSATLKELIRANEVFWGAEAEVIRSYWDSPIRSRASDRKWLTHQIYKEYWDGVVGPLAVFNRYLKDAGAKAGRAKLIAQAEVLHEEVEHFALFADLYLVLEGQDYAMSPEELKERGAWSENDALMSLRRAHREEAPELGRRAQQLTEGGHCALFAEGMKLAGRRGFDDAVAEVCRRIYEDEFNHMLLGIVELDDGDLSATDWARLTRFTVAQMKARITMRNAQFSRPVSDERIAELLAGRAEPVPFDFAYAQQLVRHAGRGR